jgi:putative SOS response-associated peptidase YedK
MRASQIGAQSMCGRYALYGPISRHRGTKTDEELPEWWDRLAETIDARPPRYNVAPTDRMPVVGLTRDGDISIRELRWGLVPYWAKDIKIGYKAINARAEGIAVKPMFREAFRRRRCLVPACGYFEWKGDAKMKKPYFIHSPHAQILFFAGLWESWRESKDAEPLYTYTVVTGPPGIVSGDIHDRAPIMLTPDVWNEWLRAEPDQAAILLASAKEPMLAFHPVPKAVGSPKNDTPDLVEPLVA